MHSDSQTLETTKGGLRFKEPKSEKSRRSIPLTPEAIAALRRHRVRQNKNRLALGPLYDTEKDLVFPDPHQGKGAPWDPDAFGKAFAWIVRSKPGVPRVRLHDTRHTAATLYLKAGVDLKVVSDILGHSTVATTANIYAHVLEGMKQEAVSRFGTLLRAAGNP